jgi:hypothetical protein
MEIKTPLVYFTGISSPPLVFKFGTANILNRLTNIIITIYFRKINPFKNYVSKVAMMVYFITVNVVSF